jgi:shikimate kinase
MNIFLVGPMGAGKTTIGKQLAKKMNLRFVDSDHEIEERTGAKISLIFEIEGEEGFRDREQAMLDELTQNSNIVLATGGGVILREANRQALKRRGTVIYLNTSVDEALRRTARDRSRPLLQADDREQRMRALMDEREPLYRAAADLIVDTDKRTVRSIIAEISHKLATE